MEEVEEQLKHTYNTDKLFRTYQFKLEEVEGFRYVLCNFFDFIKNISLKKIIN